MFGKLIKYELKSNGKVLFPAFGIGIGGALVLHFLQWMFAQASDTVGVVVYAIFMAVVSIYAICIAVFAIGYVVVRFFRSMVGNEAYLTLTLPVRNTIHIWVKFLCGMLFSFLGLCAAFVTTIAYSFDFTVSGNGLSSSQITSIVLWVICICIVVLSYMLMELFFCCAVGSQFKNKVLASVVSYFAAHNAIGFITIIPVFLVIIRAGQNAPAWVLELEQVLLLLETNPIAAMGDFLGYL